MLPSDDITTHAVILLEGSALYCRLIADAYVHTNGYYHRLSMVRTGLNEHSVGTLDSKLVRTHSVRTQWFALSSDAHYGNAWLAQVCAVGCGGRNLCCTLSVYFIAAEFFYKHGM